MRPSRGLFTGTVFVGSFLLFQVQPMVARMALPELGGASAVWNSAMLVYQALLLGGYAWAHLLARWPARRQAVAQLALLALAAVWLPVHLVGWEPPQGQAVYLFVPWLLVASVGPLVFAVSAQAPLMQRWYGAAVPGSDPYPLYAASNLGSFTGLLAYPLVVEPMLGLDRQRWAWAAAYAGLLLLVAVCATALVRSVRAEAAAASPDPEPGLESGLEPAREPIPPRRILLWLALSAVPSGLMLSTTTHLSTDVMAMPLLWALPLGLYLLSFTVAFAARRRPARVLSVVALPVLVVGGGLSLMVSTAGTGPQGLLALALLFTVAVALHSRLYDTRPEVSRLTFFYLVTAVGGALGGLWCALLAPLVFDWGYEHPLLLLAAALLVPVHRVFGRLDLGAVPGSVAAGVALAAAMGAALWWSDGWSIRLGLVLGLVVLALLAASRRTVLVAATVALMLGMGAATMQASLAGERQRSYFGIYRVSDDPEQPLRGLVHGTTLHGLQWTTPEQRDVATTYYGPTSGVGLTLAAAPQWYDAARVGVVGLGAGTLACYARPGQRWQYFELDRAVVRIARDSGSFTFLRDCTPDAPVVVGDARLTLQRVPDDSLDVLVVDAFSSDAIPMHLLTREAFEGYDRVLAPDGVLLVHITNRFLDLQPVLRGLSRWGWSSVKRNDEPDAASAELARTPSTWVALSRDPAVLSRLTSTTDRTAPPGTSWWAQLAVDAPVRHWTDDRASVLPLIAWSRAG